MPPTAPATGSKRSSSSRCLREDESSVFTTAVDNFLRCHVLRGCWALGRFLMGCWPCTHH